ncbi:MAG: hypothetical protein IPJ66_06265 [Bacteroidetes bacterium]|nr:hypothetical protein [Bacteroidota bacterium]
MNKTFGTTFLDKIRNKFGGTTNGAYTSVAGDPSSDDYSYFLNPDFSTNNVSPLDRYKRYNGQEGKFSCERNDKRCSINCHNFAGCRGHQP